MSVYTRFDSTVTSPDSYFPFYYSQLLMSLKRIAPRLSPEMVIDIYEQLSEVWCLMLPFKERLETLEELYLWCKSTKLKSFLVAQGIHKVDHWIGFVDCIGMLYKEMCRLYRVRPSPQMAKKLNM